MKKLSFFSKPFRSNFFCLALFTVCLISFASCGDDEEEEDIPGISIVGTWKSTYLETWNKINGEFDDDSYEGPFTDISFVFDKNGNVTMNWDEPLSGKYVLSGDKLILSGDGEKNEMKVLELTESTLVLEYYFDDGVWEGEHLTGYMKVKLKKVK